MVSFETEYQKILDQISKIDPLKYGRTRNYIDGAVSYLSPYISRGVISTKLVFNNLIERGYEPKRIEKFIQELAWRDYWQQVWIAKGDKINDDLKSVQADVNNFEIPKALIDGKTGIDAIDKAIKDFYNTGYFHNHVRMYIASIACNIGKSHWKIPAQWMYYYLLDADWASNSLSWQWVAGTNSKKKYYANQNNINKFCYTKQKNTFIDVEYEEFKNLEIPDELKETTIQNLNTTLPEKKQIIINTKLPTLIYNFYNLDPIWKKDIEANRILLLEPSHFEEYSVSEKTIDFILQLGKNIKSLQVYVGEFDELVKEYDLNNIYYKEHPFNNHYSGIEESRDWLSTVTGFYPSFFAFWKKCKKEIL